MNPSSDSHDFAEEHATPASPPTPSPTGPLEGFDPDGDGWGVRFKPRAWDQLKAWLRRVTHPEPEPPTR